MRRFIISLLLCAALILQSSIVFASETAETDELLPEQTYLSAMGAPELWDKLSEKGKAPGEGVTVAVLDTGLSLSPDIEDNLWTNEAELNGEEGVDDDQNGYIDDIHGLSLTNDHDITDTNGHGTMMTGIIAMGRGNGGGVGIAYGAKIMTVRISKTRNFGIDDLIEGINYAADNGADIISMSLGTIYPTKDLKEAVQKASEKCILVAAAGNEKRYASESIYQSGVYPAAYPEVIGVMSTDNDGNMSEFTNWCSSDEDIYNIAAPGEKILSTHLKGAYKTDSGTSQSAAEVAAAAAIMRGLFPEKTLDELRQTLLDCMKYKTVFDEAHGGEHRLLYLPDIWKMFEEQPVEAPTEPITEPETVAPANEPNPPKPVVVSKKTNPVKVTVKLKTVKAKRLKAKKQKVKPLTIKHAKGRVTVKFVKKGTSFKIFRRLSANSKGEITLKKGKYTKKLYKVNLKITAKGNSNYKSSSKTVTVKIKIK
ncbi:MAG: S8 family serine peptidase [Ruminococcus sp.]|nr:S8 family serine peptidase [Ruminococcus sp.]